MSANETFLGKSFFGKLPLEITKYTAKELRCEERYQYTFCYLKDYRCFYPVCRFLLVDNVSFSFVDNEMYLITINTLPNP